MLRKTSKPDLRREVLTEVPVDEVLRVLKDFLFAGATKVEAHKDAGSRFTVAGYFVQDASQGESYE